MSDAKLCGCGKPVRYIVQNGDGTTDACNKYGRCQTWEQLREQNETMRIQLSVAVDYCRDLLGCWSWKMGERAGNDKEYDSLIGFIEIAAPMTESNEAKSD